MGIDDFTQSARKYENLQFFSKSELKLKK